MKKIITWATPAGKTKNICKSCEKKLAGNWPKDENGNEYCQVQHGEHSGQCDICQK